jgi:hypothetical protein
MTAGLPRISNNGSLWHQEEDKHFMKIGMKIGLALAVLIGTPSVMTLFGPSTSVYATTGTATYDKQLKNITHAFNQRLSTLQLTYSNSGNMAALKKNLNTVLEAAINSNDYLHYIVKTYSYKATLTGNKASVSLHFTYWETLPQTNEVKKRITQILSKILTPGMNDHQKEKAIHDWIVSNISYDTRLVSHSAYDGLIKGKTVCQGYALITFEMMKQAGIPVKIVEGTSRGIAHTWNLVQIGGKWYHLDSTWDDPVPDDAGRVVYNYYNLTDSQLRTDHKWKVSTLYPLAITSYDKTLTSLSVADLTKAAFYNKLYEQIGYIYLTDAKTATNLQNLTSKIHTAIDKRQHELTIRYTNGATVTSDMKKAFAAQSGISSYSYTYEAYTRTIENDKLLRIEFHYLGD